MSRPRRSPEIHTRHGDLIMRRRQERGFSRKEVAAYVGVSETTVWRWELAGSKPKNWEAWLLLRYLGFQGPDQETFLEEMDLATVDRGPEPAEMNATKLDKPSLTGDVEQEIQDISRELDHLGLLLRPAMLSRYVAEAASKIVGRLRPLVRREATSRDPNQRIVWVFMRALLLLAYAQRNFLPVEELGRAMGPVNEAIDVSDLANIDDERTRHLLADLYEERGRQKRMSGYCEAADEDLEDGLGYAEAPGLRRESYINLGLLYIDSPEVASRKYGSFEGALQRALDERPWPSAQEEVFGVSRIQGFALLGRALRGGSALDGDEALKEIDRLRVTSDRRGPLDLIRLDITEAAVRLKRPRERSKGILVGLRTWQVARIHELPYLQFEIARMLEPFGGINPLLRQYRKML